jgi:hypothetical protein
MRTLLCCAVALVVAGGCGVSGYYVADVYRRGNDLWVRKCELSSSWTERRPDPNACRIEPVGDLPAELAPQSPRAEP